MNDILIEIIDEKKELTEKFNYNFFKKYIDCEILNKLLEIEKKYTEIIYLIDLINSVNSNEKTLIAIDQKTLLNSKNKLKKLKYELSEKLNKIDNINIIKNDKEKQLKTQYKKDLILISDNSLSRQMYTNYIELLLNERIDNLYKTYYLANKLINKNKTHLELEDYKIITNKKMLEQINTKINKFINKILYFPYNHNKITENNLLFLINNIEIIKDILNCVNNIEKKDESFKIITNIKEIKRKDNLKIESIIEKIILKITTDKTIDNPKQLLDDLKTTLEEFRQTYKIKYQKNQYCLKK